MPYETIKTIFRNHSREARKKDKTSQSTTNTPSSSTSINNEIGNMLEDFKSDMLHTFALKIHNESKEEVRGSRKSLGYIFP